MALFKDNPLDDFAPNSRQAWRDWLAENHDKATGIWLVYHKKNSGTPSVSYDEAVEEALCYGWIDSVPNKMDEARYKQLFSPRRPKSPWSRVNKIRIEQLLANGLMMPPGQQKIDAAKADGSWTLLDAVEDLVIPDDLRAALDAVPAASAFFSAFAPSYQKGILWWVVSAKRPETRQARIEKTVLMAAVNKKANFDG